jgi:hypothetical protein
MERLIRGIDEMLTERSKSPPVGLPEPQTGVGSPAPAGAPDGQRDDATHGEQRLETVPEPTPLAGSEQARGSQLDGTPAAETATLLAPSRQTGDPSPLDLPKQPSPGDGDHPGETEAQPGTVAEPVPVLSNITSPEHPMTAVDGEGRRKSSEPKIFPSSTEGL